MSIAVQAPSTTTVGHRIRAARLQRGMSLRALGEACGWDGPRIANYECHRYTPDLSSVIVMAKALSVSAGWLAFGEQ